MRTSPVTVREVADRCGLSVMTVSRVLRGSPLHRPETRARVLAAARELNYRPRALARGFRTGKTGIIGFLFRQVPHQSVPADMFYARIIEGLESELIEKGYKVLLASVQQHEIEQAQLPSVWVDGYVEGLIVLGAMSRPWLMRLRAAGVPVVLVDAEEPGFSAVVTANFEGGYKAGRYLAELGHRRAAIITGSAPDANFAAREAGFCEAIREYTGTDLRVPVFAGDAWTDGGAVAARQLIREGCAATAVFCVNDHLAIYAMKELQAAGRRVPGDISVMGFDNIDVAEHTSPPLTTMAVAKEQMGRQAARLMTRLLHHQPSPQSLVEKLQPQLVQRTSVGAPSANAA